MSKDQNTWDDGLRHFCVNHFYWIASFIFLVSMVVGAGMAYSYFSQQVQHNADDLKEMKEDVREIKTYSILSEKRLSTIAEHLERKNERETANMIRKLIRDLEKQRSK